VNAPAVVVISPCRNEEATLPTTIECMRRQTRPPAMWVVVDDGSTDGTPAILARAAATIPWLTVVRRDDRGFRKLGGGVIDAFYDGLGAVRRHHEFVVKMDVDLEFGPRCFERALAWFERNPRLGALSGKVFRREHGGLVEERMIDEMVAGQFKFYRRAAFDDIGGFVREVMWDGIDFHRARMRGWLTASVRDEELRLIHLRLMGSSDRGVHRGRLRWGRGQWFMGSAFPYVLASGLFRTIERPWVVGGALIVCGYVGAALRRAPRFDDPEFRRELRRWQYRTLWRRVTGRSTTADSPLVAPV
jgi:glycosyltransferase involved in cell wall biosynthesis